MQQRPPDLPDYRLPPVNEVVVGVQFNPAEKYQQIHAGEVWALFRADYPIVEEQPALPPMFETFGGRSIPQMGFGFITGATHDRFWFLSADGRELIQFQADRLLHNWRRLGEGPDTYPRFERVVDKFRSELIALDGYFSSLAPQALTISQCEISYINQIVLNSDLPNPQDWLRFLSFPNGDQPSDLLASMRSVISDPNGIPLARLTIDTNSGLTNIGEPMIQLTLTVRGAPPGSSVDNAIEFLCMGREKIVRRFTELTTDLAHQKWERLK